MHPDLMEIAYSNDKDVRCYQSFVEDPTNPKKLRLFRKRFGNNLDSEAVKLHNRLLLSENAAFYNSAYGQPKNCIEIMQGSKNKDSKIFKVRVGLGPRKFFHSVITESGDFLLTKDWTGSFETITSIYVIDINNHDYKSV
ncbi:MAG: hypothetical protein K2H21_01135 [Muribaculaceae bacterium]|nr:hypothetical protein [Muribaculaceae bacterium]